MSTTLVQQQGAGASPLAAAEGEATVLVGCPYHRNPRRVSVSEPPGECNQEDGKRHVCGEKLVPLSGRMIFVGCPDRECPRHRFVVEVSITEDPRTCVDEGEQIGCGKMLVRRTMYRCDNSRCEEYYRPLPTQHSGRCHACRKMRKRL